MPVLLLAQCMQRRSDVANRGGNACYHKLGHCARLRTRCGSTICAYSPIARVFLHAGFPIARASKYL